MAIDRKTGYLFGVMFGMWVILAATARAATFPSADELATASQAQLLAWMVVIEAGVIVALSGVIVQAYRNRVKALEKQIDACRVCAKEMAAARGGGK